MSLLRSDLVAVELAMLGWSGEKMSFSVAEGALARYPANMIGGVVWVVDGDPL